MTPITVQRWKATNRGYDYDQSSLSDMGYQKQEFDADSGELVSADEDDDADGDLDDDFDIGH